VTPVLNGLAGTAADTSHTVGAALSPYGLAACKTNIVQRTETGAFSAGYTGVGGVEFFRVHKHGIKNMIDKAAADPILQGESRPGKCRLVSDQKSGLADDGFRLPDALKSLLPRGSGKQGDIIFRHENCHAPLVVESFDGAELRKILTGVSNASAAGHDKIDVPVSRETCVFKPVLHDPRNPPRISGHNDDPWVFGVQFGKIAAADFFKQIDNPVADLAADSAGDILTVARPGKI